MYRLCTQYLTAFSFAMLLAVAVEAQQENGRSAARDLTESQVREMIDKLASSSFAERQKASKDLLNVTSEFVSLLEDIAKSSSGETQARLRVILPQVRNRLFNDQLGAFLKQPSVETAQSLPQWERFENICGHDEGSLSIFSQILEAEKKLFATRLFAMRELPAMLESRTAEIAKQFNGNADEEFPIASVAAVMLLGSETETRLVRGTSTNISSALDDPRFSRIVKDGIHSRALRALVGAWIVRKNIATERPLLFSMQHDLEAGRTVAVRVIESKSRRPDMILSILCLAKLNSTADLPLIETLLDNKTILWPQRGQVVKTLISGEPPVDTNYNIQTCDVALIAATHLRGISPTEISGTARTSDLTLFAIDSIGFSTDEARSQAFAAYRKLAAANTVPGGK